MSAPPKASVACGSCGHTYNAAAWHALEAIQTFGEAELRPHVVAWPKGREIEVRACGRCGRTIARLSTPPVGACG